MVDTPEQTPQEPPKKDNSFLTRLDVNVVYDLAAQMGHPYTDEEKKRFEQIKQETLGDFDGGSVFPSISGSLMRMFYMLVSFVQGIFHGDNMNGNFTDWAKDTYGQTVNSGELYMLEQATMRMNVAMKQSGMPNLVATADAVTGQRVKGSSVPMTDPDKSVFSQIGNGIQKGDGSIFTGSPRGESLNLANQNPADNLASPMTPPGARQFAQRYPS
jgi:hypothetical protein